MRALLVIALLAGGAGVAHAYPQFQLSTGAQRCNQCHIAPAGGGLLSSYGRDEAGDTISRGGDGRVLHGAWTPPSWWTFGADLRAALLGDSEGATAAGAPEIVAFPMQADLYSSFKWRSLSFNVTVGARGETRARMQPLSSYLYSREWYLMWRPKQQGPYVRIGRFYAPFGLRLAEHFTWIRRYEGFGTLEETAGVSAGIVKDRWEAHATAFMPDPIQTPVGEEAHGVALYGERRWGGLLAVGIEARAAIAAHDQHYTIGGLAKRWVPGLHTLFMAELDYARQPIELTAYTNNGLIGYAGASWFPLRGIMVTAAGERYDEDLRAPGVGRSAIDLQVNYFPRAHFEAVLTGRVTNTEGELIMLQLHYYL
jgi:hypothetical protein